MKSARWVILGVVLFIAAAALHAMYRDYFDWFEYDRSTPLDARLTPLKIGEFSCQYELRLASADGEDIVALLDVPTTPPPYPVIILQGGYHRGKDALNLVGEKAVGRGYAVLSMDYRYTGSVDNPVLLYFQVRGALRDATLDLRRVLDYLETRDDLRRNQVAMVGVSLGALFGPIVTAVDGRIDYLALIYGGGNLGEIVRANSIFHPIPTEIVVVISRVLYAPFEPLKYAPRISPTPLLMINGAGDQWVPESCARAFYKKVGEPKTILWHDRGHIRSFHTEEIMRLTDECLGWLDERLNHESREPTAMEHTLSTMARDPSVPY